MKTRITIEQIIRWYIATSWWMPFAKFFIGRKHTIKISAKYYIWKAKRNIVKYHTHCDYDDMIETIITMKTLEVITKDDRYKSTLDRQISDILKGFKSNKNEN